MLPQTSQLKQQIYNGDIVSLVYWYTEICNNAEDLRTGSRWFDPRLSKYSLPGLMIVIATGFIPLSPLSVVLTTVKWESSKSLGKNIVQITGLKNSRNAWIDALAAAIKQMLLKTALNTIQSISNAGNVLHD